MKISKKLVVIISIITIILLASAAVTYAWYSTSMKSQIEVNLESEGHIAIKFEADVVFDNSSAGSLKPAIAIAGDSTFLTAMDMLNATKVAEVANVIKFNTQFAYWTGFDETVTRFTMGLTAYVQGATSGNPDYYDLVEGGEVAFVAVFTYHTMVIMYDGTNYYIDEDYHGEPTSSDYVLNGLDAELSTLWWTIDGAAEITGDGSLIFSGGGMVLTPNTEVSMKLYVFLAKTDELIDPAINGDTLDVVLSLNTDAL